MTQATEIKGNPEKVDALRKADACERAVSLREAIHHHDYLYYIKTDPVIDDEAYDRLVQELQAIEQRWPELSTPDSPILRVGEQPSPSFGTVDHPTPMLSLKAIHTRSEFEDFVSLCSQETEARPVGFLAEPKYDGISVEITYRDGVLSRAATRGDGRSGEDVTKNVRTIRDLVLRLRGEDPPSKLIIRGEVYISKEDFAALNSGREERGQSLFANPRNAAAGSLRQLDPSITASRPLRIHAWALVADSQQVPATQWDCLQRLEEMGLPTSGKASRVNSTDEAAEYVDRLRRLRKELSYEIDGCVFKVDDLSVHEVLGTRETNPRWAVAWKFPPRQALARIRRIEAQVGRTGVLTPVALLEPVRIGGVEVSRVSLHNQDEIDRQDIRIGDHVRVERSGDVIPHVVDVETGKRNGTEKRYRLPESCPSCGGRVTRPEGMAVARCVNTACPAQRRERLLHFASPEAMDIDGLGKHVAEQLIERQQVQDVAALYELETKDILQLDRMGERSASNLLNAIDRSRKSATLSRVIHGLGIPQVGQALAADLAGAAESLQGLLNLDDASLDDLGGVGPAVRRSILDWIAEERNRSLVDRLRENGIDPRHEEEGERLEGRKLALTGTLDSMTRDQAEKAIREQGGRATGSVSSQTDGLVVGTDPGDRKTSAAEEHDTPVVEEETFLELLGRKEPDDDKPPEEEAFEEP